MLLAAADDYELMASEAQRKEIATNKGAAAERE